MRCAVHDQLFADGGGVSRDGHLDAAKVEFT
jgi:hypothetical protein